MATPTATSPEKNGQKHQPYQRKISGHRLLPQPAAKQGGMNKHRGYMHVFYLLFTIITLNSAGAQGIDQGTPKTHCTKMFNFSRVVGQRVGEAANPGPGDSPRDGGGDRRGWAHHGGDHGWLTGRGDPDTTQDVAGLWACECDSLWLDSHTEEEQGDATVQEDGITACEHCDVPAQGATAPWLKLQEFYSDASRDAEAIRKLNEEQLKLCAPKAAAALAGNLEKDAGNTNEQAKASSPAQQSSPAPAAEGQAAASSNGKEDEWHKVSRSKKKLR